MDPSDYSVPASMPILETDRLFGTKADEVQPMPSLMPPAAPISTIPYVNEAIKTLPPEDIVVIQGVRTIRWGGLLYLLHCMGQPFFYSEELGDDRVKTPLSTGDTFCVRFRVKLSLIPNATYRRYMGWDEVTANAVSQMRTSAYGSATNTNLRAAKMAPFAVEMAETRACCRAARMYLGISMCSAEEMGADDTPDEVLPSPEKQAPVIGPTKGFATKPPVPVEPAIGNRAANITAINAVRLKANVPSLIATFLESHNALVIDQLTDKELDALRETIEKAVGHAQDDKA